MSLRPVKYVAVAHPAGPGLFSTLYVLALAEIADLGTTWAASMHGGVEANPLMAQAMAHGGLAALAEWKLWTVATVAFVLAVLSPHRRALPLRAVQVASLILALVALSNLAVLA